MAGVDLSAPLEQVPERAKVALGYAEDAIAFAAAAIQGAESSAITAMYGRNRATEVNP